MVTVPIVTEVTKAQLDALVAADGLNEGLQYKVTDKNWLLVATSENTLKASTGELTMLNSDSLPDYITVDLLFIDTGEVTNVAETLINFPSGYFPIAIELKVLATVDVANYEIANLGAAQRIGAEDMGLVHCSTAVLISDTSLSFVIRQANYSAGETFRAIISCFRFKIV